jgi:hydrogenase nickel incorporation protein HypB
MNFLAGPGAGKTTLLERTIQRLGAERPMLVIEGDLLTQRDAERIAAAGGHAIQIVTHGTCHLESRMIEGALQGISLERYSAVVIENVGNLVCPSGFDLGESARVVIGSVPEGDDKPSKYPFIYMRAEAVVLNKIDLLPHTPFSRTAFWEGVRSVNPGAARFEISCTTRAGLTEWQAWFASRLTSRSEAQTR